MSGRPQKRKRRGGSKKVKRQRIKKLVREAKKGQRDIERVMRETDDAILRLAHDRSAPGAYTKPVSW